MFLATRTGATVPERCTGAGTGGVGPREGISGGIGVFWDGWIGYRLGLLLRSHCVMLIGARVRYYCLGAARGLGACGETWYLRHGGGIGAARKYGVWVWKGGRNDSKLEAFKLFNCRFGAVVRRCGLTLSSVVRPDRELAIV